MLGAADAVLDRRNGGITACRVVLQIVVMFGNGRTALPDGVKEIGVMAFSNCDKLVKVQLPATLNTIGQMAFYHNTSLESVNFMGALKSIGDGAFLDCHSLKPSDESIQSTSAPASISAGTLCS